MHAYARSRALLVVLIVSQTYRFKTRAMKLNSIEASSRVKINFLEALYRFHRQQGNPRIAAPTINHKAVDLWLLRKEVQKLGGFEEVRHDTPSEPAELKEIPRSTKRKNGQTLDA